MSVRQSMRNGISKETRDASVRLEYDRSAVYGNDRKTSRQEDAGEGSIQLLIGALGAQSRVDFDRIRPGPGLETEGMGQAVSSRT